MKKISLIVPVYNEEEMVEATYNKLKALTGSLSTKYEYEMIFTDNHSKDNTFNILHNIAKKDKNVKLIRFSRNFGYQKSIYTGYLFASGDAAIQIDCDLQDPPEMIEEFLKKWEEGYDVVYGIRVTRKENWVINTVRKIFYRFINYMSADNLPVDAGDFRLIDRKILEELRKIYDYNPYLRGLIASMGFNQIGIPYQRLARQTGVGKFRMKDYFNLSIDGIVNHSVKPLRLATLSGLIIFATTFIFIFVYIGLKIIASPPWPAGFTTLVVLLLLSISINALFIGILGEYIARIFQQIKSLPITIVEKTINLELEAEGVKSTVRSGKVA